MKINSFHTFLSKQFNKLGICVGSHPSYFIIIPVFLSLVLATGLQKWYNKNNLKYLVAPYNSRHVKEEATIAKLFPMNLSSNANMERMNREPCIAVVLITAKDQQSILRKNEFKEVLLLDKIIKNITVMERKPLKYENLCAKNNNRCFQNSILSLEDEILMENNYSIKYPLSREGKYDFRLNSLFLGGVELDKDNNVISAKAVRLFYYLNDESVYQKPIVKQWQSLFLKTMESVTFRYITVDRYTSITFEQELNNIVFKIFPLTSLSMIGILIFSMLTCLHNNWIESKPWVGVTALTSAGMALASSMGLIMYFNIPFIASVGTIPFFILGIGMDDAFVFLAAWRRTDRKDNVPNRLGKVYSESAIAVTITSLTNFIAFSSGILSQYRMVNYFCLYSSAAVVFCYIYQLTFVGAFMAIFGYLEEKKKHSLLFMKIEKSNENQSWIRRKFLSSQSWKSENGENSNTTIWIKLGKILSFWPVKSIVLLILAIFIAAGGWGITKTTLFVGSSQGSEFDSYFVKYIENTYKHFTFYEFRFQIVIDQEVNYADKEVQNQIEKILSQMEDKGLIADSLTESWIRSYVEFLKDDNINPILKAYNMSNMNDFITVLRRIFLHLPAAQRFKNDITFNSNYTAIVGSRFLCQTNFTKEEEALVNTIQKMRKITDSVPFRAFPYIFNSYWADDVALHAKFIIQMLSSVIVIIIVICFLFMPDIIIIFSVTFSVVSTEICALGFMALWKVELAAISIIVLVMCSGFSVDYAAHLSHAYSECKNSDHNERLRNSINSIGLAIFQGSVTTIISILPLAYPISHAFISLFKIIFLVILFSAINALVFLPVLLTTLYSIKNKICGKKFTVHKNFGENINLGFQS